ncbi:MAG TPA: SRPBCC domain-containing protein [Solirubrobacteraceae bacterium]|nr:SRPBCC domain-containing protein [Solirubrobacteraceae bacterium]
MAQRSATIGGDPARPGVRLERSLALPPADLWLSLTDRSRLAVWFPCDVEVAGARWEPGAGILFTFPPEVIEMTLTGSVITVDEPAELAYSWGDEVLRFQVFADSEGSRLVLVNELAPAHAARNAAGWESCLDRLEGREPSTDDWREDFARYRDAFEPVLGPQEGPPADYKGET